MSFSEPVDIMTLAVSSVTTSAYQEQFGWRAGVDSSIQVAPRVVHQLQLAAKEGSKARNFEFDRERSWTFKPVQVTVRSTLEPGQRNPAPLMERLQQIEERTNTELRLLSQQGATLTIACAAVSAEHARVVVHEGAATLLIPTDVAFDPTGNSTNLSDWLNSIADGRQLASSDTAEVARGALQSSEPAVRAAGGRALSAAAPHLALELLPALIEAERNKFTRSILRGALSSARA